jgi:hypothetical protein
VAAKFWPKTVQRCDQCYCLQVYQDLNRISVRREKNADTSNGRPAVVFFGVSDAKDGATARSAQLL